MRILHVNKFLHRRGGAESYMLDLAAAQKEVGDDVAFFGMDHPQNARQRFAEHFPKFVELEPPPATLRGRLAAGARMVYSPSSRRGMAEVVDAYRPDVVHLHNIYHQLSPSILQPLRATGTPTVMTVHDYKLICPSYLLLDHGEVCEACLDGRFSHALRRRCKDDSLAASGLLALESGIHRKTHAYDPVQAFICPSRFLAEMLTRAGVYPNRLEVLGNFVDTRSIRPKERPGGGIVFAGRLSKEKGVDVLLEAVQQLDAVRLDIAGEGPERETIAATAALRAPGRVQLHGQLSRAALLELIRSAAVVVVPSRCQENQPMVVLEAFACGVPVIATERGGLPELLQDGRYGATVPADDAVALAASLSRLLADPMATFARGTLARAAAERDFSLERHLDRIREIYERVRSTRRRTVRATAGSRDRDS